jgi:CRP-like cAMP-binding protein
MPREALIRDVPLLARLAQQDLRALASRGRMRRYRTGAVLFREGDPGDALHIVVEGAVRVSVLSAAGSEATVAVLGPGEFVGDLALLDGRPRSASAIMLQPTTTLAVTREDFRRWLRERPRAALALLEALSLRIRRTDEQFADLAFLDAPHRLAKRLIALAAGQSGSRVAPGARLRVTQAELASMLGVSRESVNKHLNELARKKLVALGRGSVTLLDPDALASAG